MPVAAFGLERIGGSELLILLLIVLVLFGARRLPDLARSLGRSLNEFKKGREEGARDGAKKDEAAGTEKPPADEEHGEK